MNRPTTILTSIALVAILLALPAATIAGPAPGIPLIVSETVCADEDLAGHLCGASLAWVTRYDGPETDQDAAGAVVTSPDGSRAYVAGTRLGWGTGLDAMVIAYDTEEGDEVWLSSYNGPGNADDRANRIALSADGSRVFVAGTRTGAGTSNDYFVIAYDAQTGDEIWTAHYDNGASDYLNALELSSDGSRVFVAGHSAGVGTGTDFAIAAFDATDGDLVWSARHNGPQNGTEAWPSLAVTPDGSRAVLAGYGTGVGTFDYVTVAFDATDGTELWNVRFDGPNHGADFGNGVAVSPDGTRAFVTGQATGLAGISITIAYDMEDGTQLWIDQYSALGLNDGTRQIEMAPDGSRLYVGGYTKIGANNDAIVRAYDPATGDILWTATYDAGSHDGIQALVATPDGSTLFATGESTGSTTRYDIATLALDATDGSQLWVGRYNGPDDRDDRPTGIALSPDATRVFVVGVSPGGATGDDAVTLAYDDRLSVQVPEPEIPEP